MVGDPLWSSFWSKITKKIGVCACSAIISVLLVCNKNSDILDANLGCPKVSGLNEFNDLYKKNYVCRSSKLSRNQCIMDALNLLDKMKG